LRRPCLLVRGADSNVLGAAIAREFIELAADATLAEVPQAGHMVAGDNNDAFATAICAWLDTFMRSAPPRLTA
jgi:pimeloyl-ACP methyl ester carboxylesterase